jgi:O-antigen ligase
LQSPALLLWGIRQNFRFFIFYYSCTVFLKKEDYDILFDVVKIVFWVSLPLCAYEALLVSYPAGSIVGDYVGGIYYGIQGVNTPLNIILILYTAKSFINYYEKQITFSKLILILAAALAMATFAELKIFLLEIVIIAVLVMLNNGLSFKSVLFIVIGIVSFGIVVQAFVDINGVGRSYYTTDYLSISGMIENALRSSGYDGNGDLNRFFAVQTLTDMFFKNDPIGFLYGLGLGNAEYSAGYAFLTSNFYLEYSWLHYQYFSVSFVFIETGIIGLILYFGIFIRAGAQGIKCIDKNYKDRMLFLIMIIMMIIMVFYNPSLRNEQSGFILYMILAMPMVYKKEENSVKQVCRIKGLEGEA